MTRINESIPAAGDASFLSSRQLTDRINQLGDDERLHPAGVSVLSLFYAKFISDEILDTKRSSCPIQMHDDIDVPVFDGRTDQSSGSPVNLVSAWLDGSAVYGMSAEHESLLRSWKNGTLKACDRKRGSSSLS